MTDTLTRAEETVTAVAPPKKRPYGKPAPSLLRMFMKTWYQKSIGDGLFQPIPHDKAQFRTGYDAWNTLLVGNGPTHGWGVTTHGLSLTGQLGVALTRSAGQPVDVDYVGDEAMNAATSIDWLAGTNIEEYDLIVLVLSMNDAMRMSDPNKWAADISRLMEKLRAERKLGTPLLVVGMQPVASVHGYNNFIGVIAQRWADKLNGIMKGMTDASGDAFMLLPAGQHEPGRPFGSPSTYAAWAADIADLGAYLLPAGVPGERVQQEKEWAWSGTEKTMGWDGVDRTAALRKLAEEARAEFKLPIVNITLLDEHVQLLPNAHGSLPVSIPRHLTYCDETVKRDDIMIVENSAKDERFKDNDYLDLIHMPFYAGKAIKDRDGEVIGSFCLMAPFPRAKESVDEARLEMYARKAQEALWAIEDGD